MESEDLIKLPRSTNLPGGRDDDGVSTSCCKCPRSDMLCKNSEVENDGENLRTHENLVNLVVNVSSSSGTKRPCMTVDAQQQPSARVIYNSLTRERREKLEELLQEWSGWCSPHCTFSSDSNEVLESGEKIYFPALVLGTEKASAVPFCIDNQRKNPANKEFLPLDGNSIPLSDRGFSPDLTPVDGPNNLKSHTLRECPKPRGSVSLDKARKKNESGRIQNTSSRNPAWYLQRSSRGKFDGPGFLKSETRQMVAPVALDPPPGLNRMQEIEHPPGYQVVQVDPSNPDTWKDLVFKENTHVLSFYAQYGLKRGFRVKINYRKPRRGFDKELLYYLSYACNKEGVKKVDKNSEARNVIRRANTRTECKAHLKADYDPSLGGYRIKEWFDEHTHEFVNPDFAHIVPSNRHINEGQSILVSISLCSGISIRSTDESRSVVVEGCDMIPEEATGVAESA